MIEVLIWIVGIAFAVFYALLLAALWWKPDDPHPLPCPHGYKDWDMCPDCCH